MVEDFKKAINIANELEKDIIEFEKDLEYKRVRSIALFTARKIKEQIPMYMGNINPKWLIYDNVVNIIKGRINGE